MNFELDEPYLEIQRQARDFARAIEPVAVQADEMRNPSGCTGCITGKWLE